MARVKPHLTDPTVETVLVQDFNKFTMARWHYRLKPV